MRKSWLWVLTLPLAAYAAYQAFRFASPAYETLRVTRTRVRDTVTAEAFVIRDERVLTDPISGVCRYVPEDGEHVAKNGPVIEVYADAAAAAAKDRAEALEDEIARLSQIAAGTDDGALDLTEAENRVFEDYLNVLRLFDNGQIRRARKMSESVLMQMNRKQIAAGEAAGFADRIAELQSKAADLKSQGNRISVIRAPQAGYYVRRADGYESAAAYDKALKLTPADLARIRAFVPDAGSFAGKIISSHEWYLAAVLPGEAASALRPGASVTLELPLSETAEIPAKTAAINRENVTGEAAVIFRCDRMNAELAKIRMPRVDVVLRSFEGYRIPAEAVRIKDGTVGVYVIKGRTARFRPVKILHAVSDGYLVSADGELELYDEVIVRGKGLYDGKILD